MRKKYHVDLTTSEQAFLEAILQKAKISARKLKRAYVLLAADRNGDKTWKDQAIAEAYGLTRKSVENIRQRFVEEGLEITLHGKKQEVYREKIFTGEVEAHLLALRCSHPPEGYQEWTYRLLADKMVELCYVPQMSYESVRKILKKTNSSPGR